MSYAKHIQALDAVIKSIDVSDKGRKKYQIQNMQEFLKVIENSSLPADCKSKLTDELHYCIRGAQDELRKL